MSSSRTRKIMRAFLPPTHLMQMKHAQFRIEVSSAPTTVIMFCLDYTTVCDAWQCNEADKESRLLSSKKGEKGKRRMQLIRSSMLIDSTVAPAAASW